MIELRKVGNRLEATDKVSGKELFVEVRKHNRKVYLPQILKFIDHLASPKIRMRYGGGIYISPGGYSTSVLTYLEANGITNVKLGEVDGQNLRWIYPTTETVLPPQRQKATYIGVFTAKGGVGKTTVSAHLAGAFAINGYDVALVDLDKEGNLRKLLGEGVYLPKRDGIGSAITVLNHDEWDETNEDESKVIVCDCSPNFEANPLEMVKKFDYCIIPTTLNPLGINRNSDVIKRTFEQVREHNKKAELFVLINSYQSDQTLLGRNRQLNHLLQEDLAPFLKRDQKAFYIDPIEEFAIRYSTTLLYWGYEAVVEGLDPQLSFQAFGGRSYPRDDFMRLAEYLEAHTHIDALKKGNT